MPTIIVRSDWPESISDTTSLVERVVPNASRDEAYIRQLVERILWALEDAETSRPEPQYQSWTSTDQRAESPPGVTLT